MPDLSPDILHKLILTAFEGRDRAYAPYSNFRVGAALLTDDGEMIPGCNVENASYGGCICAERTAMLRAIVHTSLASFNSRHASGKRKFTTIIVTSDVPEPTTSPCGICRQFIREFCALNTPIYMVSSLYPLDNPSPPSWLTQKDSEEYGKLLRMMTLGELLPMSFGPENLHK